MVSFQCEQCGDVVKKPQVPKHSQRCRMGKYSCIDCSNIFVGDAIKGHTWCMSEAEKYEGALYQGKKKGKGSQQNGHKNQSQQNNGKSQPLAVSEKKTDDSAPAPVKDKEESKGGLVQEKIKWKQTIRKTLKKSENKSMNLGQLKKAVIEKFMKASDGKVSEEELQKTFVQKLEKLDNVVVTVKLQ